MKKLILLIQAVLFLGSVLYTLIVTPAHALMGKKGEAQQVRCTDDKGNHNGYGSKCGDGECSCTPNPC